MASKVQKHILAAAVELFAQHGIDGTTTKEIAAKADATEGSLFRVFGSKDDLFEAVIERINNEQMTAEEFGELLNRDGPFEDVVTDALRRHYRALGREYARLIVFANLTRPKLAQKVFGPRSAKLVKLLSDRVARELGDKSSRPAHSKMAYAAAYGILADLFTYRLNRDIYERPLQEREFVDESIRLWINAISALRK